MIDNPRGTAANSMKLAGLLLITVLGAAHLKADDWPEWRGKGRQGVWNETGILEKFPAGGLKAVWRTPIHNAYAGPSVSEGRVFVSDSEPKGRGGAVTERALALDEATGKLLWATEWDTDYSAIQLVYAIGPRATPTVDGETVYVLGAVGDLMALESKTGKVLWKKSYVKDFGLDMPAWGTPGAPLVEGPLLICIAGGEPDSKVVALDKRTGEVVWRALSSESEPGYSQPQVIEANGVRQLIIWHPAGMASLNPETGKVYWEIPLRTIMGMTISTPVRSGNYILVTSQRLGSRVIKLDETKPGASVVWAGPGDIDPGYPAANSLNTVISTGVIQGDYVYSLDFTGTLHCIELKTGKPVWESNELLTERAQYGTAFFVRNGDRYFINNDRGELLIAKLSPQGFEVIDRTKVIDPTHPYVRRREFPGVLWSHAAYANKHMIIRNDHEIVRYSLAKE
jgi:outer membrane protein assembly factor BamB